MPTHSCLRMLLAHHDEGVTDATHTAHHAPPAALEAKDPRIDVSGAGASQCRGYRHWVREPLGGGPPRPRRAACAGVQELHACAHRPGRVLALSAVGAATLRRYGAIDYGPKWHLRPALWRKRLSSQGDTSHHQQRTAQAPESERPSTRRGNGAHRRSKDTG